MGVKQIRRGCITIVGLSAPKILGSTTEFLDIRFHFAGETANVPVLSRFNIRRIVGENSDHREIMTA